MWAKPFLQPKLVFTWIPRAVFSAGVAGSAAQAGFLQKFPKVCSAWAKPFLQPRLVFTRISRGVLGVGGTLSAAHAGFHGNSQTCEQRD